MKEFRVCPTCGYGRGFHVSFSKGDPGFSILFICPECGSAFDLSIAEDRLQDIRPENRGRFRSYP